MLSQWYPGYHKCGILIFFLMYIGKMDVHYQPINVHLYATWISKLLHFKEHWFIYSCSFKIEYLKPNKIVTIIISLHNSLWTGSARPTVQPAVILQLCHLKQLEQ